MFSRRSFLAASSATALAACTPATRPRFVPGLPLLAIDSHTHVFNGRDIPIRGFVSQVALRQDAAPVGPNRLDGLVRLLSLILFSGTPTAREELAQIRRAARSGGVITARSKDQLLAADRANVRRAISEFEQSLRDNRIPEIGLSPDELVYNHLCDLMGARAQEELLHAPPFSQAGNITDAIYAPDVIERLTRNPPPGNEDFDAVALVQTIRWGGILTRPRQDIVTELVCLYGPGENEEVGLDAFVASLVDFELWLQADDPPSDMPAQVDVVSAIARARQDVVMLNFVPFCPLRAALEARAGRDPLGLVRHAVERKGFCGIKLYPPMGFTPIGNDPARRYGVKPGRTANGAEIDRALTRLYRWCEANSVPIKAHANETAAAQPCSGANANPALWGPILTRYPGLRVNFAHFGDFQHEQRPSRDDGCPAEPSFEDEAARIAAAFPNAYLDASFLVDTLPNRGRRGAIVRSIRNVLDRHPGAAAKVLYGSDWSMIGRIPGHPAYLESVKAAFGEVGLPLETVMRDNILRWLGFAPGSPQLRRLARFFGDHPKFGTGFGSLLG